MADEEKKPCPFGCDGSGRRLVDDLTVSECDCSYLRRLRIHMGPEIAGAPRVEGVCPLYSRDDGVDLTKKNVVIQGYWTDVLPHLREVLYWKGTLFRYKVLTDERLRTVYVGAEAYTSRARSKRDDLDTFNTLNDIVGPELDLVVIRLGHLGHKNIAMPGVLKEALMLREVAQRPTWIIESPDAPYAPGHLAFSEEAFDYIQRRFEIVEISTYEPGRLESAPQGYSIRQLPAGQPRMLPPRPETVPGMEVEEDTATEIAVEPSEVPPNSMFNLDMPGSNKKKTKYKPNKGRRYDGGG